MLPKAPKGKNPFAKDGKAPAGKGKPMPFQPKGKMMPKKGGRGG